MTKTAKAAFTDGLRRRFAAFRTCEVVLTSYFFYTAAMATWYALPARQQVAGWTLPLVLSLLALWETRFTRRWSSIMRDWAPLAFILPGYWQADWFSYPALHDWQSTWIGWDRVLLEGTGLRSGIEMWGGALPSLFETAYLLLYSIPPLSLGLVYFYAGRRSVDRFLTALLCGTLLVYALLPHFPTVSPRISFPGEDLPSYAGKARSMNLYLLDHFDIGNSVFPSGHVAVAFSTAFGLLLVMPGRRRVWSTAFLTATAVLIATVYGRYHYLADGLASIGISLVSWRFTRALFANA